MSKHSPTIGLFVPSIATYDLWRGVTRAAQKRNAGLYSFVGLRFRDARQFNAQANAVYDLAIASRLDGLVIWTSSVGNNVGPEGMLEFCRRYAPLPIVGIGMVMPGLPSVILDSYQGVYDGVTHLIEVHGCRRIAFIRGIAGHFGAEERYRAYRDVLAAHGLDYDPALVSEPSDWDPEWGGEAIREFLDRRRVQFDGLAGAGDDLVTGAIQALQERGISVPNRVAAVGFNDSPLSRIVSPPLTTAPIRMYRLGHTAVDLLLDWLDGTPPPPVVRLPTRLIVRQSCGCVDPIVERAAIPPALVGSALEPGFSAVPQAEVFARFQAGLEAMEISDEPLGRLFQALVRDLDDPAGGGNFLAVMDQILRETESQEGSLLAWQDVVSELRRCLVPYLAPNSPQLIRMENRIAQARLAISAFARRAQAYQTWLSDQRTERLHRLDRTLVTVTGIQELLNVLIAELPALGIPGCYLSLYDDPQNPAAGAHLYLAYNTGGLIPLPAEGLPFVPSELIPDILLAAPGPCYRVIESLHFRDEKLGFVIFDVGAPEGGVYDLLAVQISSALKGALLWVKNIRLYQEALEAQEEAREADRLKGRFLSMVSHELRTPLSLLVGLSEMLLQEETLGKLSLPAPYRQDLARIHVSAQQLDGLIRDVLDLTLSQVGQLRLVRKPVHLGDVLESVAMVGEQLAREKGLDWHVDLPPSLPWVMGDRIRLQQVALNLVNNAVKFTPRGSVRLAAEVSDDEVTIRIYDTGIGVPPEEQKRIFDEFRQSEWSASKGYGGLGIGLALCCQLVELHEGRIGVESSGAEAGGSMFYFTLPVLSGWGNPEPGVVGRGRMVLVLAGPGGEGRELLLPLRQSGFTAEALELDPDNVWVARIAAQLPGVVILDARLALQYGWAAMTALKNDPVTADIPVLFLSLSENQERGAALALDYLTKPLDTATLVDVLHRQGLTWEENEAGYKVVLVVDDESGIRDVHARMVQSQLPRCRVLQAANGREALEIMQRARPDLILLDLVMPEVDGFGVLEAMHSSSTLRDIPVIVLTAKTLTESDMVRLNQGVTAVLQKGLFSIEETLVQVGEALERGWGAGGEAQQIARRVMAYIHEHYEEPLTREELAAYAGVGERHLNRCFRRETGMAPTTYLIRYRLKLAKTLLEKGELSVAEIALAVGFSDSNYFARIFRREIGVAPGAYKRGERLSEP